MANISVPIQDKLYKNCKYMISQYCNEKYDQEHKQRTNKKHSYKYRCFYSLPTTGIFAYNFNPHGIPGNKWNCNVERVFRIGILVNVPKEWHIGYHGTPYSNLNNLYYSGFQLQISKSGQTLAIPCYDDDIYDIYLTPSFNIAFMYGFRNCNKGTRHFGVVDDKWCCTIVL